MHLNPYKWAMRYQSFAKVFGILLGLGVLFSIVEGNSPLVAVCLTLSGYVPFVAFAVLMDPLGPRLSKALPEHHLYLQETYRLTPEEFETYWKVWKKRHLYASVPCVLVFFGMIGAMLYLGRSWVWAFHVYALFSGLFYALVQLICAFVYYRCPKPYIPQDHEHFSHPHSSTYKTSTDIRRIDNSGNAWVAGTPAWNARVMSDTFNRLNNS